ncbi:MAG: biotin--[acetyl-CoA-carboxylase] ligase [Bdellovibrionales bacterium]|nr:biotin--[acetyl-CoA-carboxylase] ligase [Bdellovibrionales bacterium]
MEVRDRIASWEILLETALPAFNGRVLCVQSCSSTMELARSQITTQPSLTLAANQTAGRGRQGRVWLAAHQGMYATIALPYRGEVSRLSGLSLMIGCVVQQVLAERGCHTLVKWPNDLLDRGDRKLAGILIEVEKVESHFCILIGIGINISEAPLSEGVALYDLCGKTFAPYDLLSWIVNSMSPDWELFCREGFKPFVSRWQSVAAWIGRRVELHNAHSVVEGKFSGVDSEGRIEILSERGVDRFAAGDLVLSSRSLEN